MVNHITVNGSVKQVVNTLSCGPGEKPHTYELKGGSYVFEIGGVWWLAEKGQSKRNVEVA